MADENKIDKAPVIYLERRGTNYTCRDCVFYEARRCKLYDKKVQIKPWGGCNLWVQSKTKPGDIPWIGGTTKEETGYLENQDGFSCKRCEEFLPDDGACKKVAGKISPNGCCNRWEKLEKKNPE